MPAGIEVTPSDPLTGLPCPVLMKSADFYLLGPGHRRLEQLRADYHHMLHPQRSPELGYDAEGKKLSKEDLNVMGGLALRYSMGEYMPRWLHAIYHDIFYGPEILSDVDWKYTRAVLACAGVVPRMAINLYKPGEWSIDSLSNKQHDFIRRRIFYEGASSLNNRRSRANEIGRFFADYIISQTLPEVADEKVVHGRIKEFLEPTSVEQWQKAGSFVIGFAADASVREVNKLYKDAISEGLVAEKHQARQLGEVILKYFKRERFPEYFGKLETHARPLVT